eukprot:TRINITY_DN471_c0_g1_i1.p1 TRINITY_DN471_c0_g1~~TRINITY_DN471_c0_g1_i1.p1  ORF type:complete len:246 (-),score=47.81 TRINITY_DN471_c0_g1_i1:422-1159(-)
MILLIGEIFQNVLFLLLILSSGPKADQMMTPEWPIYTSSTPHVIKTEYFEYATLLDSIFTFLSEEERKHNNFVVVELGAGFGHWITNAHKAVESIKRKMLGSENDPELSEIKRCLHFGGGVEVNLVAVEAERTHFSMLKQHLTTNGIDPKSHQHLLLNVAIVEKGPEVFFKSTDPYQDWGQSVQEKGAPNSVPVPAISLAQLFSLFTLNVDLMYIDVQGIEHKVLSSFASNWNSSKESVYQHSWS